MHSFAYHRPTSIEAAAEIFAASEEPSYLAGGMTLIPSMKNRLLAPSDLIDLSPIPELFGISSADGRLEIGGMTRHVDVSTKARQTLPALAALAGGIGDPAVRHRGTIGGSVANADPAADYPAAVLGLDATVVTNKREIAADDFFTGMFETALEEGEMIVRVRFPIPRRAVYRKFRSLASGYAAVGVFVAQLADSQIRVAITGAGPSAFRSGEMEAALAEDFRPEALKGIQTDPGELLSDIHYSAEYRAHIINVEASRAVEVLLAGAGR